MAIHEPSLLLSRLRQDRMHLFAALVERASVTPGAHFCRLLRAGHVDVTTCGELVCLARGVAAALARRAPPSGGIVPIVLEHGPMLFASFIGCTFAGLVPAFLPPLTRKQDPVVFRAAMQALLERIRPACVIGSAATLDLVGAGWPLLDVAAIVPAATVGSHPVAAPDDLAFLQHSSGTTGLKKGVCLSHGTVLRQITAYAAAIEANAADIVASWLPLYHDMGLITAFLMPAVLGMEIIFLDPLEWVSQPTLLLDAIEHHQATLCWQPNFAFHHIVRLAEPDRQWDLARLRLLVSCSEPCRPAAFDAFAARFAASGLRADALATSYAMAENVFAVTQSEPGGVVRSGNGAAAGFLSSGRAVRGVRMRVTDAAGADLPAGELGEIHIAGDCLFQGYHRQPDLTAERLRDGWYRTGDIGLIDDHDELFVIGRLDDVLNINGRKLVAHEIEDALNAVPGIAAGRVIVFAEYEAESGATELAVAAERMPGDATHDSAVAAALRRTVHALCGLRPKRVQFVARGFLLKSTSGKISRQASVRKLLAQSGPQGATHD